MKFKSSFFFALGVLIAANLFAADEVYHPADVTPPAVPREFRGAWVTEVAASPDWPSKPGLSAAEQKAELISLLDRAKRLHLNAIVLQVRPACDAVYDSPIEPWSEFLTGAQGKPPQPLYDPLAFAVAEAHKRGLELHAWFNPFRAWLSTAKSSPAPNHVSRTHPDWVHKYGDQLWLDPGNPDVRQYVLRVVMDVVKRYDIDGVQFDDYFYPYPERDARGRTLEFPDYTTWREYGDGQNRDDWRRANINEFVQSVYQNIKAVKPWVKFGISPFGIWRPGYPKQIKGLDAYASLYADSRLWLEKGWVDYFSPQLYWPINPPQQSFPALLDWWAQQNARHRSLWPGLNGAGIGDKFSANEIARQIQITRNQPDATGEIIYHLRDLLDDPSLNTLFRAQNTRAALVPAMPWVNSTPPGKPQIFAAVTRSNLTMHWTAATNQIPKLWVLQFREPDNVWATQIVPATQSGCIFSKSSPDVISIREVDRYGNMSPPAALEKYLLPNTKRR